MHAIIAIQARTTVPIGQDATWQRRPNTCAPVAPVAVQPHQYTAGDEGNARSTNIFGKPMPEASTSLE
jgi:hypothetical protein